MAAPASALRPLPIPPSAPRRPRPGERVVFHPLRSGPGARVGAWTVQSPGRRSCSTSILPVRTSAARSQLPVSSLFGHGHGLSFAGHAIHFQVMCLRESNRLSGSPFAARKRKQHRKPLPRAQPCQTELLLLVYCYSYCYYYYYFYAHVQMYLCMYIVCVLSIDIHIYNLQNMKTYKVGHG